MSWNPESLSTVARPDRSRTSRRNDRAGQSMHHVWMSVVTSAPLLLRAWSGRLLHSRRPHPRPSRETVETAQLLIGMPATSAELVLSWVIVRCRRDMSPLNAFQFRRRRDGEPAGPRCGRTGTAMAGWLVKPAGGPARLRTARGHGLANLAVHLRRRAAAAAGHDCRHELQPRDRARRHRKRPALPVGAHRGGPLRAHSPFCSEQPSAGGGHFCVSPSFDIRSPGCQGATEQ